MKPQEKIIRTYDATAASYAATRIDELSGIHLDRVLLREFASLNQNKGKCADFGCGPGHVTRFLFDSGLKDIVGVDISPEMVKTAKQYFPEVNFESGNLLNLPYDDEYFGSAIAFYAIVNFNKDQLTEAFKEIYRVLKGGADLLFSFHVGDGVVHFDSVRDIEVDIDMYLWKMKDIVALIGKIGFDTITALERMPYLNVEYDSQRGYVWARKR